MEVCDTDHSGYIDRKEFQDFFASTNIIASNHEINQIFDEFDDSGNGKLSVEEFAKVIMRFFISEGNDDFSQEYASGSENSMN